MTWTANVHRTVLPNGVTLLVERYPVAPVVSAVTHVRAGYFDEPDRWVGISHVLEHMYFKGTPTHPGGRLADEIQRLGGYLNAATIYDKTVYYTVLPTAPGVLREALALQADALRHPQLDPDDLARELEVIVQEANRKLDSPAAVLRETLYDVLYAQHRIRRWRIGTEEGLRRLTATDVRAYHRTRYTPDRVVVALVGDLEIDEARAEAEACFGSWDRAPSPVEPSPPEREPPEPAFRVLRGDVERPMVSLGWRTVHGLHADAYALDMAAAVLGRGRGAWLSRAVRNPGLASAASSTHYTPGDVGVFDVTVEGEASRIDRAMRAGLDLVERLATRGVDPIDLDRARALTAVMWSRRMETMDGRAMTFCEFEGLGDLSLTDRSYDRTLTVGGEEIRDAAARYLRPAAASGVAYLDEEMPPPDASHGWPAAAGGGTDLQPISSPRPPGIRTGGSATGGETPETRGEHRAVEQADLVLRPKPRCGMVVLGWYATGLRDAETPETAGISALLARSAVRGAGGMDADQLSAAAELIGGVITPSVVAGAVGWSVTVPREAAAAAAELLVTVARDATLAGEALDIERRLQVSDAKRARDNMFGYPVSRVLGMALPRSPYGLPALGEPESVASLTDQAVRRWADALRAARPVIVVVGDLDVGEMVDAVTPALARSPALFPVPSAPPDVTWTAGRGSETRDKAQTAIAMAFPAPPRNDPRRYALAVAGSLLGGLAGRLFHALRERRSLAYTVTATPWQRQSAGAMLTYIATDPRREDEARSVMLEELARLEREPPGPDELLRARNYAAGEVQLRQQSAHAVAWEWLEAWIYDELDTVEREPDRLRSVSDEDIRAVARAVFGAESRAEYVVRGTRGSASSPAGGTTGSSRDA